MLKAEILYERNCPNYARACQILCRVIAEYALETEIIIREARPTDQTFFGSPTMLIGGIDVEKCYQEDNSESKSEPLFSACRIFACEEHVGCPSEDMIKCAFRELETHLN